MIPIALRSAWIFWVSAAGVIYAYAGYPLLVWLLSFGHAPWVPALLVIVNAMAAIAMAGLGAPRLRQVEQRIPEDARHPADQRHVVPRDRTEARLLRDDPVRAERG